MLFWKCIFIYFNVIYLNRSIINTQWGQNIFTCLLFLPSVFQQRAGNAEKFDYVSQLAKDYNKSFHSSCCFWLWLTYSDFSSAGHELFEEDGRKWICWFQQCHVCWAAISVDVNINHTVKISSPLSVSVFMLSIICMVGSIEASEYLHDLS